ncbi:phospholipase D-like domain-containing protein [Sorangium sp. So ce367]|uniref:phospholipase D-like domain-containing protein n=1 Tax=Sorangium sp. So ce367 TaxID=3133305 RepID=UPI003F5F4281
MGPELEKLGVPALKRLVEALERRLLTWPPTATALRSKQIHENSEALATDLKALHAAFSSIEEGVAVLKLLKTERARCEEEQRRRLTLVWSGPEGASQSRDTAVAVKELFTTAKRKVLLSTFNLGTPDLLKPLVERQKNPPHLDVRLFLCINKQLMRGWMERDTMVQDTSEQGKKHRYPEDPEAVFRERFKRKYWPDVLLPQVFYDTRKQFVLHAKCVIVDDEVAYVGSANLSKWAHTDNFEAGVIVRDPRFAKELAQQFEQLAYKGKMRKVAW